MVSSDRNKLREDVNRSRTERLKWKEKNSWRKTYLCICWWFGDVWPEKMFLCFSFSSSAKVQLDSLRWSRAEGRELNWTLKFKLNSLVQFHHQKLWNVSFNIYCKMKPSDVFQVRLKTQFHVWFVHFVWFKEKNVQLKVLMKMFSTKHDPLLLPMFWPNVRRSPVTIVSLNCCQSHNMNKANWCFSLLSC